MSFFKHIVFSVTLLVALSSVSSSQALADDGNSGDATITVTLPDKDPDGNVNWDVWPQHATAPEPGIGLYTGEGGAYSDLYPKRRCKNQFQCTFKVPCNQLKAYTLLKPIDVDPGVPDHPFDERLCKMNDTCVFKKSGLTATVEIRGCKKDTRVPDCSHCKKVPGRIIAPSYNVLSGKSHCVFIGDKAKVDEILAVYDAVDTGVSFVTTGGGLAAKTITTAGRQMTVIDYANPNIIIKKMLKVSTDSFGVVSSQMDMVAKTGQGCQPKLIQPSSVP